MKEFIGERFLVQNDFLYPFALHPSEKDSFIINWANPLGIGCSTGTIHTAVHNVQPKVFESGDFHNGDFGRGKPKQGPATASLPAGRQGFRLDFFAPLFLSRKKME